MTKEFAKSIDRRGFLHLGLCVGMAAAAGCGGEDAGTIQPNPSAGNKSRLEKLKGIGKSSPATKGAGAAEKKTGETSPKPEDTPAKKE